MKSSDKKYNELFGETNKRHMYCIYGDCYENIEIYCGFDRKNSS